MVSNAVPHFFDITSTLPGESKSWSPNTLKTRTALNYKGIPYTQSYISYPDIQGLLQNLSIGPSQGMIEYHLPAIVHPASIPSNVNPHGAMNESFAIALHLDKVYPAPQSPPLFPSEASYALAVVVEKMMRACVFKTAGFIIPKTVNILDNRGAEHFRRTRESPRMFGKPLSEVQLQGEELEKSWQPLLEDMELLAKMLRGREGSQEQKGPFFEGEKVGYADLMVASFLAWFERVDKGDWQRLMNVGEGELKKLYDACVPWINGQGEEKEHPAANL